MKIKDAKAYFDLGVLISFEAVRDPVVLDSWHLQISGKEGRLWILETAKGTHKSFASLDTLIGEVESITGRVTGVRIGI